MVRKYNREKIPKVYNIDEIEYYDSKPGIKHQLFRGMNSIASVVTIESHTKPEPQSHPWAHECTFVLEGEADFYIDGKKRHVEEGDIFFVPPDIEHFVETHETGCKLFNCWQLREDYLPYTEYQEEFYSSFD